MNSGGVAQAEVESGFAGGEPAAGQRHVPDLLGAAGAQAHGGPEGLAAIAEGADETNPHGVARRPPFR